MGDSKSCGRKVVLVRVRPGAPILSQRFSAVCREDRVDVSERFGNAVGKVIVPDTFWPVLTRLTPVRAVLAFARMSDR